MSNEDKPRGMRIPAGTPWDEVLGIIAGTHEMLEVFTHIDDKDPTILTRYNVTALNRHCHENKLQIFRVPITSEAAEICKNQRGVEQHRLDRLTEKSLLHPAIFCLQEDGSAVMVDGTHRVVWAWDHGYREIYGYVLKPEVWKPFILPLKDYEKGMTGEELLKKDSGIL